MLGWGDSPTNGAPTTRVFDCKSNSGVSTLVVSVVPTADIPGVAGFSVALTAWVGGEGEISPCCGPWLPPPLPPYWDLGPGGCRAGAISASAGFQGGPDPNPVLDPLGSALFLAKPWFLETSLNVPGALPESSTVGRYAMEGVLDGTTADLLAGHEYYLATITLRHTKAAMPGGCSGCCTSVRFSPVIRLTGTGGSLLATITGQDPPGVWQGFSGQGACEVVPARTSTWGALKSVYR